MDKSEIQKLIDEKLKKKNIKIRNKNAVEALFALFGPASALWKILSGSQDALDLEKNKITQETILEILLAIDEKLETGKTNQDSFDILLEGIIAYGDVTGLKATTSNPLLAKLFSKKDINVKLKNICTSGNVVGVDLSVDKELELKKKLHIESGTGSVKFDPSPGRRIIFGKKPEEKNKDA